MLEYRMGRLSIFMARKSAASLLVVLLPLASIILGWQAVEGAGRLYVFGDSYVDTGNNAQETPNISDYWRPPYGISWPGYPFGRFSDGRIFSDRFARYLRVNSPITYSSLNISNWEEDGFDVKAGINFAIAGSGTFSTENPYAYNVSVQIERLQITIDKGIVSTQDLADSTALLVLNGNDYSNFLSLHPDMEGILDFVPLVAAHIADDAKSLSEFGFKNIAINTLGLHGCLPVFCSPNNYSQCDETINMLAAWHNSLLTQHLQEQLPSSSFQILNFYDAVKAILESGKFMVPLEPCCQGIGGNNCGAVNEDNEPQYTVCSDRDQHVFWDGVHLTHAGYKALIGTLFPAHDTL